MVWRLAHQGFDYVGEFLGYPICDGTPTGYYGPKGVPVLCILGSP